MPKSTEKPISSLKQRGQNRWSVEGSTPHGGRQRLDTSHAKKALPRKRPPPSVAEIAPEPTPDDTVPEKVGKVPRAVAEDVGQGGRSRRRTARGSAPWASRHAAKHAAEVAARNASPAPPGSARATLRTPEAADVIKERIGKLHAHLSGIERLHRDLARNFYEIGTILAEIREGCLYDAKGYSSLESFLDRELPLGRVRALLCLRIVETFKREAALANGMELLAAALRAMDESTALRPAHPLGPPGQDAGVRSSRR